MLAHSRRELEIPVVDDDTFAGRLAELSRHRRRLLSFARESLGDVPAPVRDGTTSSQDVL